MTYFVSQNPPSDDILIELGRMAIEEKGFVDFLDELAALGFLLVYEQDQGMSKEEFDELVRTRWNTMKRAWRLRNRES